MLDANHNDIETLPDFYGCTALKEIYLANNYIKVSIDYILKTIEMKKTTNLFSVVPKCLWQSRSITNITLKQWTDMDPAFSN